MKNIESQSYQNIRVLISYDDRKDLSYLKGLPWECIYMKRPAIRKDATFPYNLYENELMRRVKSGWIMFLDDDDQLTCKHSIEKIINFITSDDDLILWRVRLPDKVVPEDEYFGKLPVQRKHISGIGFMFNSKHINIAQWDANKASDHRVIQRLTGVAKNIIWIDEVLTGLQVGMKEKRAEGFGRRVDKPGKIFQKVYALLSPFFR
jgi:hypothetical protein